MTGAHKRNPLRELLSPGPSLETEDDEDEDFVVDDEAEGEADEEEDEEGSSSEEEGDDEDDEATEDVQGSAAGAATASRAGDTAPAAMSDAQRSTGGGAADSTAEMRRRLQELRAALGGGEDDVVFEEEILSDSDISEHFPEEEADAEEAAALQRLAAGGDLLPGESGTSDEEYSSDGEEAEEASDEGSRGGGQRADAAEARRSAADAAAMPPPPPRPPAAAATGVQTPASALPDTSAAPAGAMPAPGAGQRPLPEGLLPPGGSELPLPSDDPFAFPADDGGMSVFGAQLGRLTDPIAHRTRAHHSLAQVSIEELEQMLQVDDELEGLALDDEAEYQRFLQSLRANEGSAALGSFLDDDGEDSDDGDFFQELRAMLGGPGGQGGARGEPAGAEAGRRRKPKERQPRPRRPRGAKPPRWTRAAAGERTIESVAALREHRLRPLAPKAFITDLTRLTTLAAAAAGLEDPRPPVAVDTIVGPLLVPAAAVSGPPLPPLPPHIKRAPVAWHPPLPAAVRKYLPAEAAAVERLPAGAPPAGGAELAPAAFQPKQYKQLYRLIHQHTQLLMQVYLMAATSTDPAHTDVARQAQRMADELRGFMLGQAASRQAQGVAAYNPEALGCSDQLPPAPPPPTHAGIDGGRRLSRLQREVEARQRLDAAQAAWQPWSSAAVFTVADVAPLRWMEHVMAGAPLPPEGSPHEQPAAGQEQGQPEGQREQQEQQPPNMLQGTPEEGARGGEEGEADETSSDDEDVAVDRIRRRRQSKRKPAAPPLHHALWSGLPPRAAAAVADVKPLLEPVLTPRAPDHVATAQLLFTPAEDELLALGIQKYGYDWARIRAELLPTKTPKQMANRKKNRTLNTAPDNCIKDAVGAVNGELQADEVALLEKAVAYYGRQPRRWELICQHYLPHRQPAVLATLWSRHTNRASVLEPHRASGGMRKSLKRRGLSGGSSEPPEQEGSGAVEAGGSGVAPGALQEQRRPAMQQPAARQRRRGVQQAAVDAAAAGGRPTVRSMFMAGECGGAAPVALGGGIAMAPSQQGPAPPLLLPPGPRPGGGAGEPEQELQQQQVAGQEAGLCSPGAAFLASPIPGSQRQQQQAAAGTGALFHAVSERPGSMQLASQHAPGPLFEQEELADSDDDAATPAEPLQQQRRPLLPTAAAAPKPSAMPAHLAQTELADADAEHAVAAAPAPVEPSARQPAAEAALDGAPQPRQKRRRQTVDATASAATVQQAEPDAEEQPAEPLPGVQADVTLGPPPPVRRSARAAAKRQRQEAEAELEQTAAATQGAGSEQQQQQQQQQVQQQQQQVQQVQDTRRAPAAPRQDSKPAPKRRRAGKQQKQQVPDLVPGFTQPGNPVFEQEELPDSDNEGHADVGGCAAPAAAAASATTARDDAGQPAQGREMWQTSQSRLAASAGSEPGGLAPQQWQQPEKQAPAGSSGRQQPQQGKATATAPAATWSVDEDKLLLRTLLKAGGRLSAEQLADLTKMVGGAASGRTEDIVADRCLALLQRYQENQQRKQAAAAAVAADPEQQQHAQPA